MHSPDVPEVQLHPTQGDLKASGRQSIPIPWPMGKKGAEIAYLLEH